MYVGVGQDSSGHYTVTSKIFCAEQNIWNKEK
jgi:hypothetical protein